MVFCADEATDLSNKQELAILCIRWAHNDFSIHEDVVELVNVPKTDAGTLTTAKKNCLFFCRLPLAQCRGQAYDGASNMSGHLTGVAAQIQSESICSIYTLFCPLYKSLSAVGWSNLCCCSGCADGTVHLIRYSQKRSSVFASLQHQLSPNAHSVSPTRWTE